MLTFLYHLLSKSFIVLLVALLSVNYLPDKLFGDFQFEPVFMKPNNFDSVIPKWNTLLTDKNTEYIQLNQIVGPESVAVASNGLLYTGLVDGRIVELDPGNNYKLRQILRFNKARKCRDNVALQDVDCGRFLQLRFSNDSLYAIESNTGLYKIDIKSGSMKHVGPKKLNELSLFNSFAFDSVDRNLVYITISSTRKNLQNIMWGLLELESSGQIVALDIKTGKRVIVLDNLVMVNGVDVDKKRDRLLFSESSKSQISMISLKDIREAFKVTQDGSKLKNVGRSPLIALVPGIPDNIIVEGDIAYIALPLVKPSGVELMDHLASMPGIRKAIGRFIYGSGKLLKYIHENLYNHPLLEVAYRELMSGHILYRVTQTEGSAVIEYNLATGASELKGTNSFSHLSEAVPDNQGNLILGSFRSPFLVKVKV